MTELVTRFVVAVESIAAALTAFAAQQTASAGNGTPAGTDSSADTGPKRTRRTKAEMEADKAREDTEKAAATPAPQAAATPAPQAAAPDKAPIASATGTTPAFDYAELRANVIKLATQFGDDGKKKAISTLASFGVAKADQAPPEKWPEMNAAFEAAIAEFSAPKTEDEFA